MGIVFLAVQEPLGRRVAVKVLQEGGHDVSFRERFMSEASICAQLSHPHIVTIHDYGQTDEGALFMVMEYVEGETLDRVLGRELRLDPDRSISLIKRVGAALAHAHRAGIVHRDLKPSNIVLTRTAEGEGLKVLDFGIAKAFLGARADVEDLTEAGKLIGTPRFMAPEQIRKARIDQRADLYALGVLSYLVMAGRPPFEAEGDVALMNAHLEAAIPNLPATLSQREPELDFIVRWLMQKRPEGRPGTAEELLTHLGAVERLRGLGPDTVLRSSSRIAHSSGALETLMEDGARAPSSKPSLAVAPGDRRWGLALALLLLPILVLGVLWWRGAADSGAERSERASEAQIRVDAEEQGGGRAGARDAPAVPRGAAADAAPSQKERPEPGRSAGPADAIGSSPSAASGASNPNGGARRSEAAASGSSTRVASDTPPPRPRPVANEARRRSRRTERGKRSVARPPPPAEPTPPSPKDEAAQEEPKDKVPVLLDEVEPSSVPVVD